MFKVVTLLIVFLAVARSNNVRMDGTVTAARHLEERSFEKVDEPRNADATENRRACNPTISCTLLGGRCVKNRANCDGTVDPRGCTGGKKCKICCIPDQTTTAPITCPACTCPSTVNPTTPVPFTCPTCPSTVIPTTPVPFTCPTCPSTVIPSTPIPSTFPACTCPYITPCPTTTTTTTSTTTTPSTTAGPTVNPALSWLTVGSDSFVRFSQYMNWDAARGLCQRNGLDLFHPRNATAVAIYLDDNFSTSYYWLGARGNTTAQVWVDGGSLTWEDPWYRPNSYFNNGTSDCVYVYTCCGQPSVGRVLAAPRGSCTRYSRAVLCG